MAPDTELFRDIGFVILGIILFLIPLQSTIVTFIAYALIAFGVAHTVFRINIDRTQRR